MHDIDEIRRANLAILVREFGSVAAVARLADRTPSQVSQWLNGSKNSATGKPRGMLKDTARYIERVTGKPEGWLDTFHSGPGETGAQEPPIAAATERDIASVLADALRRMPAGLRPAAGKLLESLAATPEDPHLKESLAHMITGSKRDGGNR
ncbi:hypothetical protein CO641_02270 [Lysobacteraceae bacterium NML91-0213]|nr:hypothetical protein CO641_02270 [Xanthomonadaceae bacterium NML91-0213]